MKKSTRKQVTKKEACEETMARLEKEIERLSKGHVYVEADVDILRVSLILETRNTTCRARTHNAYARVCQGVDVSVCCFKLIFCTPGLAGFALANIRTNILTSVVPPMSMAARHYQIECSAT